MRSERRLRLGLTHQCAADALGLKRQTLSGYLSLPEGKIPRPISLAAAAIEIGVIPLPTVGDGEDGKGPRRGWRRKE